MKKRPQVTTILLVCIIALFCGVFLIPMFWGILISFTDWNGLSRDYSVIWFDNYVRMFRDVRFLESLGVTLRYLCILLPSTLIAGYASAKAIYRLRRFQSGLLFLSFFPYVITPVIACILWNQIYIGLVPEIAEFLGIQAIKGNLLADKGTALFAVAFVDLWMLVPYAMLLYLSALNGIPKELLEYAQIEGANSRQIAMHIESPYILSTVGMLTTVVSSYAFTHIDTLMTLTSGGPGRATETLYYTIYKNSTLEQRYAYGLAEGLIVAFGSIGIFLMVNKLTNGDHLNVITTSSD